MIVGAHSESTDGNHAFLLRCVQLYDVTICDESLYIQLRSEEHVVDYRGRVKNTKIVRGNCFSCCRRREDDHFDDDHFDDDHFDDDHFDDNHFGNDHFDDDHFDDGKAERCCSIVKVIRISNYPTTQQKISKCQFGSGGKQCGGKRW